VAAGAWPNVVALPGCTGVLLAPALVAYAAHCGTTSPDVVFGDDVAAAVRRVPTKRCVAHPDAALGNGRDIAFCTLAAPVTDVEPLELLAAADAAELAPGISITQVGFGLDADDGVFGSKRETAGVLTTLGDDFVVQGTTGGTCAGDSGGPALVDLAELDGTRASGWRVLGLLSAGTSYRCEVSTDHYSSLDAVRDWLQSASGIELPSSDSVAEPPAAAGSASPACQLAPSGLSAGSVAGTLWAAAVLLVRGRRRRRGRSIAERERLAISN
jgi:hypothetical protein